MRAAKGLGLSPCLSQIFAAIIAKHLKVNLVQFVEPMFCVKSEVGKVAIYPQFLRHAWILCRVAKICLLPLQRSQIPPLYDVLCVGIKILQ